MGKKLNDDANRLLRENLALHNYPVSNNVGVGILSYNRGHSLKRLIDSIRSYTDLRRTTVFVSDDASTDLYTRAYLDGLERDGDIVVVRGHDRLGVAGNTNRLFRCLARFRYGILLNDDVEVLAPSWDVVYPDAINRSGLHHFCMRQPGVYGAKEGDQRIINGYKVSVVDDKPHGAVMAFSNAAFAAIGYFDERFGIYGMEHVDWSNRISAAGLQPHGYYDIDGSTSFFRIHNEKSAVEERSKHLSDGKRLLASLDPKRGFVPASPVTAVPAISVVIPCRDFDRHNGILPVINGIRGQRFPSIEIIVAEHDVCRRVPVEAEPIKYALIGPGERHFNKSKAFNAGVALATTPYLILQDADLLLPAQYTAAVHASLQVHDATHMGSKVIYLMGSSTLSVVNNGIVDTNLRCERAIGYFEGGSVACRRRTYWLVGGFNEEFWGYGVEDCEFYERLSKSCNWKDNRCFDFVHMSHGRVPGWTEQHARNRDLGARICSVPMTQRIENQKAALINVGYAPFIQAAVDGVI